MTFDTLDADESGQLDRDEARQMFEDQAGRTMTDEELTQAMEAADVDDSGNVDRLEFNRFLRLKDELISATQVVTKHAIMRSCKRLLKSFVSVAAQPFKIF
eukprot:COSAG01_NODE_21306_length_908_cov_1.029666_1_plen_100_part_10